MASNPSRPSLLRRELLPDPLGLVSFGLLAAAVAGHLFLRPGADGFLFGNVLDLLPGAFRGPRFDAAFEAAGQALLILAPAMALYAGLKRLRRQASGILACLTVALGGFVSLITAVALLSVFLGAPGSR